MSTPSPFPSRASTQPQLCTGFWVGQDLQNPDFESLEDVPIGEYFLMYYLHGWCELFALALHDLFGYPMYCIVDAYELDKCGYPSLSDPQFPLVHTFCIFPDIDAENCLFVDCRGVVGNKRAFLEEFRDFFDEYQIIQYTPEQIQKMKERLSQVISESEANQCYLAAIVYIKAHIQDYEINKENRHE